MVLTVDTNPEEEGCHERGTCTRSSSQTVGVGMNGSLGSPALEFAGRMYCRILTPDGDVFDRDRCG